MKNAIKLFSILLLANCVVFISCNKDKDANTKNITAINDNTSQIVNVKLKTMKQKSFSIGCHDMSSTTFNAKIKPLDMWTVNQLTT